MISHVKLLSSVIMSQKVTHDLSGVCNRGHSITKYVDKMRGEGVKKWQNSVHVVVEWPHTERQIVSFLPSLGNHYVHMYLKVNSLFLLCAW